MTDPAPVWVLYTAKYDVGRQHSRIIPDSIRVVRTARSHISPEELAAERERTGLGGELNVTQLDVPADVADGDLVPYATQQLASEPGFDFWEEIIGDDLVVEGIAYSSDLYVPDGEGGVRELTVDERAARRRPELSQEATDQRPRPGTSVADDAIDRFLQYQASGMDATQARQEAAVAAAWHYALAVRAGEPADAYSPGFVPALPALGGFRIAEEAIERFVEYQEAGLGPRNARLFAVAAAETTEEGNPRRPVVGSTPDQQEAPHLGADHHQDYALDDAHQDVRVAELRDRAAALHAQLDRNPSETPSNSHDGVVLAHSEEEPAIGGDGTEADPPGGADLGA